MKDILLFGDVLILSSIYVDIGIQSVLEQKSIEFDTTRVDSFYKVLGHFYVHDPIQYNDEIINQMEKYDLIVLSIFSCDFYNYYYSKPKDNYLSIYEKMIIRLKSKCKKLLVIFPHKPYLGENSNESHFKEEIDICFSYYYSFLINMAKKYNFSILNLDKSINCNDRNNYIFNSHQFVNQTLNIKIGLTIIEIFKTIKENETSIFNI